MNGHSSILADEMGLGKIFYIFINFFWWFNSKIIKIKFIENKKN